MPRKKLLAVVAVSLASLLGVAGPAWAYLLITSTTVSPTSTASTLGAASAANAAAASTVAINVNVTGASSPPATSYTVRPHGNTTTTSCTISGATGTCQVTGLTPSTNYSYDIYSNLSNWNSTASTTVSTETVPAAPTSVTLTNGGGTGNAYINTANKSSITVQVGLPSTSQSSDTVHLTASDGTNTVTASTQAAPSGTGTLTFSSLNMSSLTDGTITFTAWASNSGGSSSNKTNTYTKDTVAPSQSLSFASGATGGENVTGSGDSWTVYYLGSAAGSFSLKDTVTETGSGIATNGIVFPTMSTTTGWTSPPATKSCSTSPCTSNVYTWTANPGANPASETITATDSAGNVDTLTLTFVKDSNSLGITENTDHTTGTNYFADFSGTVSSGDTGTVTVYMCSGNVSSCTSGSAVATVTATPSGTTWTGPTLASGPPVTHGSAYTAEAYETDQNGVQLTALVHFTP